MQREEFATKMNISLCVITLNEEANLRRCLESVSGVVDEIVIVDSGSNDGTRQIASEFNAKWVEQSWLGFVGQKNKAIELCENNWVLVLDADEALSCELNNEIKQLKVKGLDSGEDGFSMPRCVFYEGKWIRHGDWYPDRLIRLFRKEKARYSGGKVHERLELQGSFRKLKGDIEHYSFIDSNDHWVRAQKYAQLWAESACEQGKRASILSSLAHASHKWIRGFILRGGFLDGKTGWRIANLNAREVRLKYQLLRKMNIAGEG